MQKAVGDLINEDMKFYIPFYQRGYKWEKEHIEALLDDLWDFYENYKKEEYLLKIQEINKMNYHYYSLQPLVVKKDNQNNIYIVVDGQQRLTTIYLILSAMEEILDEKIDKFILEYERENSKDFLENIKIKTEEDSKNNIDFNYMYNAYINIKNWFYNTKDVKEKLNDFKNFILKKSDYKEVKNRKKDINNNIRFIWYEIDENENEFDVFIRLNIGKIPLTNAELIKSFIIQKTNKEYRKELSNEWDNIEYILKDNELFGFLTTKNYNTKIELLFQILLEKENYKNYELYEDFLKAYGENDTKEIWLQIKNIFYTLKFWYEDREFYHLIGYLISIGENIVNIYKLYSDATTKDKNDFKLKLKSKIKGSLSIALDEVDELSYSRDKKTLTKIFLLFNIVTLIKSSNDSYIKFSFYRFNNEKWSIEHITPQTDKISNSIVIKKELEKIKKDLNNSELNQLLSKEKLDEKDIKKLENLFSDKKVNANKDNIKNLTLLSFKNNSSLKNNFFPVKRKMIIDMDKEGKFIPIVTKNLFLKYYSAIDGNPEKWSDTDGEKYINELKDSLKNFLGDTNE